MSVAFVYKMHNRECEMSIPSSLSALPAFESNLNHRSFRKGHVLFKTLTLPSVSTVIVVEVRVPYSFPKKSALGTKIEER